MAQSAHSEMLHSAITAAGKGIGLLGFEPDQTQLIKTSIENTAAYSGLTQPEKLGLLLVKVPSPDNRQLMQQLVHHLAKLPQHLDWVSFQMADEGFPDTFFPKIIWTGYGFWYHALLDRLIKRVDTLLDIDPEWLDQFLSLFCRGYWHFHQNGACPTLQIAGGSKQNRLAAQANYAASGLPIHCVYDPRNPVERLEFESVYTLLRMAYDFESCQALSEPLQKACLAVERIAAHRNILNIHNQLPQPDVNISSVHCPSPANWLETYLTKADLLSLLSSIERIGRHLELEEEIALICDAQKHLEMLM
jgi:hypothetical protein